VKRRGSTLIETLVALAVFSLIAGVIVAVFIVSHRYSRLYRQVSLAQREATLSQQVLTRDLSLCLHSSLRPASAVNASWLLSCAPTPPNKISFASPSGEILYQRWLGIWVDPEGRLWKSFIPLPAPAPASVLDLTLAPTSISPFMAAPRKHQIGRSLSYLRLSAEEHAINLEIQINTSEDSSRPTRYRLVTTIGSL
jgi:type II secretory pathway pseudopilin PulG